jgi:anthranilate synthase component 1
LPPSGFLSRDPNLDYNSVGLSNQPPPEEGESTGQPYIPNMSRERYGQMVEKCKQAIQDGEVIQVVVSQRLARRTPVQPFDLYRSLRAINPSPYMFFLDLNGFHIIGASPELLTQVIDGKMAVHPIAGTRPRGINSEHDDELERELISDEKEVAEHLMLLDLGRNDVGRVSDPGSVEVTQSFEIEKYSHVMHIVSHVTGDLSKKYDAFDAMKAAFPAGTVSGAPKVRAMQLIAELEPEKRGPYSGAVGYFSFTGNMDTAISLRTMILKDGVAYLQAGGGIVADSDTQTEYEETLHKLGALMRAIDHAEESAGV